MSQESLDDAIKFRAGPLKEAATELDSVHLGGINISEFARESHHRRRPPYQQYCDGRDVLLRERLLQPHAGQQADDDTRWDLSRRTSQSQYFTKPLS
jgi:hypothetical protein